LTSERQVGEESEECTSVVKDNLQLSAPSRSNYLGSWLDIDGASSDRWNSAHFLLLLLLLSRRFAFKLIKNRAA
jgi:hypothetical protein